MKDGTTSGGHRQIYKDLLGRLQHADISTAANHLDLAQNGAGAVEISFYGKTYLVSNEGVRRSDGQKFLDGIGSVLIHYILRGSHSRPSGRFVTLAELAGPLFKDGSYSASALESPIIKRFSGRTLEFLEISAAIGGRQDGEGGLGSLSLIFDLLPHIPIQLVFYDRDDEFPARATLLFDGNATQLIEFEVLAVLVTIFVRLFTTP
jgi:hypothetical protein